MRRCILHIGQAKTGSSSIQNTLHKNREHLLTEHGIGYFGGSVQHRFLATVMMADSESSGTYIAKLAGPSKEAQTKYLQRLVQEFEQHLDTNGSKIEIISSEAFERISEAAVQRLQEWLAKRFDEVRVITYVRGPLEGLSSRVQQAVKGGATFEKVFSRIPTAPASASEWPGGGLMHQLSLLHEPYRKWFGPQNNTYRSFRRSELYGGDVIDDFLITTLGKDSNALGIERVHLNQALPATAVHILEAVNRAVPVFNDGFRNIQRATGLLMKLRDYPCQRKFIMHDVDWENVRYALSEEVAWLYDASSGNIDFRDEPAPVLTPSMRVEWNDDMEHMAILWHDAQHAAEQAQAKHAVANALDRLSRRGTPDPEKHRSALRRALERLTDADMLERTSLRLWRLGLDDAAKETAYRLQWLTRHTETQQRGERLMTRPEELNKQGTTL